MIVVARTVSRGLIAGLICSAGIVAGDHVFILLATFGLAAISPLPGELFVAIKIIGSIYLIWLGLKLILSKREDSGSGYKSAQRYATNFIAGLLTTLSNPKAILFYASFLPAFLDLSRVNYIDILLLLLIATLAVGGVMSLYVFFTAKLASKPRNPATKALSKWAAGSILIGSGAYIVTKP